jgi:sugar lactone lactonase YvrE
MRNLAVTLIVAAAMAADMPAPNIEFAHLYTFGSKLGIHPPRILNKRAARAALGDGENPYGLQVPTGVATDLHRRVWITDTGTASVHVFDRASGAYREFRRGGDTPLQQPWGIAADAQGRVYAADAGLGGVFVFNESGEFDRWMVKPGNHVLEKPTALALSENGRTVYVADPPRNVVVALNREGEVDGSIQLPPELGDPSAISVVANQIYVLGVREHKAAVFSPAGRPRGEFHWDGIVAPTAFTFDPARRWFLVADPKWMVVQIFDASGKNLCAFGQLGDGVDQMQHVDSLYVDPQGLVYLVDSHHGKVLVFADARHRPASRP